MNIPGLFQIHISYEKKRSIFKELTQFCQDFAACFNSADKIAVDEKLTHISMARRDIWLSFKIRHDTSIIHYF